MLILDMGALLSPARGQPHSSPQPPPAPQKASTGAPPPLSPPRPWIVPNIYGWGPATPRGNASNLYIMPRLATVPSVGGR